MDVNVTKKVRPVTNNISKQLRRALLNLLGGAPAPKKKTGPCDKCDGPHHEDDCPYFKGRKRENHKDATMNYGKKGSVSSADVVIVKSARVVPQPGDGSCLYHSLSYGLTGTAAVTNFANIYKLFPIYTTESS